jgi:hypothetical protein
VSGQAGYRRERRLEEKTIRATWFFRALSAKDQAASERETPRRWLAEVDHGNAADPTRRKESSVMRRRNWFTRASVPVVVGTILVAGYAEGDASTGPPGDATDAASSAKEHVIAGRPAAYTLPPGCGPAGKKFQCNPETNAGCDRAKDEACDDDERGGFGCYEGPNSVKEGGECDDEDGCQGGLGCDTDDDDGPDGVCKRYCCTNADCGSKKCVIIAKSFGSLGFCN